MKVVFFGRTSSGKSTVINAMLWNKILPSGIGHTTSCFVQVEGSDSQEGFLYTEDTEKPLSINVIEQLADALSSESVQGNSHIKICYPNEKCRLLKKNVVLVDSPGIDYEKDLDCWINQVCLDADVFVLVASSESCLSQTEKSFFVKLGSQMLRPNIFILQNKWDNSDDETDAELVKKKHYQRSMDFLTKELKVASEKEAEQRIFFVSAKEILRARLQKDCTPPTTKYAKERNLEFKNFESHFEMYISNNAVINKLKQYGQMGKEIAIFFMELSKRIELKVTQKIDETKKTVLMKKNQIKDLNCLITQISNIEKEKQILKDKVVKALRDIIRRVSKIIDSFEKPSSENLKADYKSRLNTYLVDCVNENLQQLCSPLLQEIQERMESKTSKIATLLPADKHAELKNIWTELNEMTDSGLYIRDFLDNFQADLDFKFFTKRNILSATGGVTTGVAEAVGIGVALRVIPALAVSIPVTAVGIGGYFAYKALKWTKKEKYEVFLEQYSEFAKSGLRINVEKISSKCAQKVHKKMSQTIRRLQSFAEEHIKDLNEQINELYKISEDLDDLHLKFIALRKELDNLDQKVEKYNKDHFLTSKTL